MKSSKAAKFKNPFDLMEEEDTEPLDLKPVRFQPPTSGKVHAPLPFDPYQQPTKDSNSLSSSAVSKQSTKAPPSHLSNKKKQPHASHSGFANPFGAEEEEEVFNTNKSTQNSYNAGPVGFNPLTVTDEPPGKGPNQQGQTYVPSQASGELNEDGDPPLLEDIGIDLSLIKQRFKMTLLVQQPDYSLLENSDLAGPILIAMAFGCLLLLSGKIHFGDIYAMFVFGNTLMYFLINYMSQSDIIPLYSIMSTLGYSLLPMLILGSMGIFFNLRGLVGILISLSIALWASLSAGNFLQVFLRQPNTNRKALLSYPLFLFYLCFGMIVIF